MSQIFANKIKHIFNILIPNNKIEWLLFIGLFIFYNIYSIPLAVNTNLLDFVGEVCYVVNDVYMGFDNANYIQKGVGDLASHSLIIFITKPILFVGNLLVSITHFPKAKIIFIVLITTYCIVTSSTIIYRYLKEIISINTLISLYLTIMYALFSSCLFYAFTFDSFTFSLLLLVFTIYWYSSKYKINSLTSYTSNLFLSIALGGVTITNLAKGIICGLFEKKSFYSKILRAISICIIFSLISIIAFLFFKNPDNAPFIFLDKYERFSKTDSIGIIEYLYRVIDTFFIAPLLSLNLTEIMHHNEPISIITYFVEEDNSIHRILNNWWRYLYALIFYTLVFSSLILNRNNKFVKMLFAIWSVDIVIHILFRFGITDSYSMFAAHWIFVFPLLLGFLYKKIKPMQRKIFSVLILIMLIIQIVNNTMIMSEFISMANKLFGI